MKKFSLLLITILLLSSCAQNKKKTTIAREIFKKEIANEFKELPVSINGILLTDIDIEDDYIVYVADLTREEWSARFMPNNAVNSDKNIARIISVVSPELLQKYIDFEVGIKYLYREVESKGSLGEIEISHERIKDIKDKLERGLLPPYTIMELLAVEMSKYELPAQIEENAWITDAYIDGKVVFYETTITEDLDGYKMTEDESKEVKNELVKELLEWTTNSLYKDELIKEEVRFIYSYKDKSGNEYMRIEIGPEDYKQ